MLKNPNVWLPFLYQHSGFVDFILKMGQNFEMNENYQDF